MRKLSLVALAIWLATSHCAALAATEYAPGELVSAGSAPFTEDWSSMAARGAASMAQATPGTVRIMPMPVGPRFRGPAPQVQAPEGSFAQPAPAAAVVIGTSFAGLNLQDEISIGVGAIPPDSMGCIGPQHFVEIINSSIAVYTRGGTRLSNVPLDTFFAVVVSGTSYPRFGTTDPRIIYDRSTGRWFACALEFGTSAGSDNNIMLAVSRTSDPTGTWDKYVIPVATPDSGSTSYLNDYDTLGLDDNGVYFGMSVFPSTGTTEWARIAATPKAQLVAASPSLGPVYQWNSITDMYVSPQPAYNMDGGGPSGRAWFVASSTTAYGNLNYRTLAWIGGAPSLSATSVLITPAYGAPLDAPALGSSTNISVGDDRVMCAVIRNSRLWTSRNVGVNSSGGSSRPNRTGCEWLELDVSSPTASLLQNGRVYDSSSSSPRFYYYPTIMASGQGNASMGFTGSKSSEYAGVYACGRLVTDAPNTMGAPTLVEGGRGVISASGRHAQPVGRLQLHKPRPKR